MPHGSLLLAACSGFSLIFHEEEATVVPLLELPLGLVSPGQCGGELFCQNLGDRTQIAGKAVTYLQGTIMP